MKRKRGGMLTFLYVAPFELLAFGDVSAAAFAALVLQSMNDPCFLVGGQEARSLGEVVEKEKCGDGDGNSYKSLDDEDPAPSSVSPHSVHLGDCVGEKTGECACDAGSTEEKTLSESHLLCAVPHGQIVGDAREQSGLSNT